MDLGCLDLGCLEVRDKCGTDNATISPTASSAKPTSKLGKSKSPRQSGQLSLNPLSKLSSQFKKSSHRTSPLNWFPRKKGDSFLKRKIKMLQEVDGVQSTLDETLGDSNPHYCRVLREQLAVSEAANKAMEARKAALVEASWCRILHAARIQSKEAETRLLQAEKISAEAVEAATAMGVIMYDKTNCPQKPSRVEKSRVNEGRPSAHVVTASFESAFEVDREVAVAVKNAFLKLVKCHSFDKDEFRDLLRKISQNPDIGETLSEISSECESESGSQLECATQNGGGTSQKPDRRMSLAEIRCRKLRRRQSLEKLNVNKLMDMMLERLRRLQEEELSSIATIVATCGLNEALDEVERNKLHDPGCTAESLSYEQVNKIQRESDLPSLDKFLVKRMSKLEIEVQELRNTKKKGCMGSTNINSDLNHDEETSDNGGTPDPTQDLESDYVKHSSSMMSERNGKSTGRLNTGIINHAKNAADVPSLDKCLVKHVSRLEREVQEAKNRRKNSIADAFVGKENTDLNTEANKTFTVNKADAEHFTEVDMQAGPVAADESLNEILVKPKLVLEKENLKASSSSNNNGISTYPKKQENCESLDKVLVKNVSRLEREKMRLDSERGWVILNKNERNTRLQTNEEPSLDQILIKHKPRLEKEKLIGAQQSDDQSRPSVTRRQARERELQEAWGGLSLGNSIRPHVSKLEQEKQLDDQARVPITRRQARERELQEAWGGLSLGNSIRPRVSRLEREKANWIKAEEEERKHVMDV